MRDGMKRVSEGALVVGCALVVGVPNASANGSPQADADVHMDGARELDRGSKRIVANRLTAPRWNVTKARVGDRVRLSVRTRPGRTVRFVIKEADAGGVDDKVVQLRAVASKGGVASASWEAEYMADTDDTLTDQEKAWGEEGFADFSAPEYVFDAIVGKQSVRSGMLRMNDVVRGFLRGAHAKAGVRFKLVFRGGGSLLGRTTVGGRYEVTDVPPGPFTLKIVED